MVQMLGEPSKRYYQVEFEHDKISSLPEHLIDNILSFLPIRDAVRTSILSRNWRYKWATIPSLEFNDKCFPFSSLYQAQIKRKLVSIIDRVFVLHKGPILKFKLSHKWFEGVADIDRWILFLSRNGVREIMLYFFRGESYKPPSCLFDCQNLIHLKLLNCSLKPPPTFKGFKNLKTLNLQLITTDQDVFEKLICSCPLLEMLTLSEFSGLTELNIDAPNLQYLDVGGDFLDVSLKNTFNLVSIFIGMYKHICNEPKADESFSKLLRFFANLPRIHRLEVQLDSMEYLARGNIPTSLPNKCLDLSDLSIDINFNSMDEIKAVLSLLRSSPNLRELTIWSRRKEQPYAGTYTNLYRDDLWSSLFTHLRAAKVSNVSGFRPELDFIEFILSNAPALESITVDPASEHGSCNFLEKVLRFRRASKHDEFFLFGYCNKM